MRPSILAIGSVAFDSIKSTYGEVDKVLGGSATYFALAASYFADVRIVAVVGEDFTVEDENKLLRRGVNLDGLEHARGKSFHWGGEYGEDVNQRTTHFTHLNVFEHFHPKVPSQYQDSRLLFLGNMDPALQLEVRRQVKGASLVGGDTMNFWIGGKRPELVQTLKEMDILLINDGEAKQLAEESNLLRAANKVLAMGPRALVIKHGEYGATVFFREGAFGIGTHPFHAPALPLDEVRDPTGAGDSFAGGFMGYVASQGELNREVLKRAMFYGGVMGSFAVERFGPERLYDLSREQIEERFQIFRELSHLP
ncbi:MAG TPA: PfkB family carbohydrate kinase [Terriglobales bacterium]|nr:PfkB family carbohydrate kinase [Terriglobales bacterium]